MTSGIMAAAALGLLLIAAPAAAESSSDADVAAMLQQQKGREGRAAERPDRRREPAQAQGRGKGGGNAQAEGRGNAGGNAQARGRRDAVGGAAKARGRVSREQVQARIRELPADVQQLSRSGRVADRLAVGAVVRGVERGLPASALSLSVLDDRVRVTNRSGEVLLDMPESRARNLGGWETRRLGDRRASDNAPAFCRSGEGHPVRGREWCLDKGFGLGSRDDRLWSRGTVEDIIFGRGGDRDERRRTEDRAGLIDVLGDVVFGRLAVHALTLGLDAPLTGLWVAEPDGPRLLRVRSDEEEIAELVDLDGDDRVDVLYVVQAR